MTYKTIINIQIDKSTTSVIVITIHFLTPIEKDRTRYGWFSIWKIYLSLLFLVIILEICAKAAHRINRYCLKRISDVTFSKNNGSNGLNMKTMKMTDGDHLEFWHSDMSKYTNDARNGLCVQWLIRKVILYPFPGLFSLELNFQFGPWWPSWIQMFGLVKIQEMIPRNKHILLKTGLLCEIQQVIWVIWLKTEKNGIGRWRPSWILILRLIKLQKWYQKWALYATFSRKSDITRVSMTIYF